MKKLWIVREPCTVLFDVKPIHKALGTEKMDSSIELELTDKEHEDYTNVTWDVSPVLKTGGAERPRVRFC